MPIETPTGLTAEDFECTICKSTFRDPFVTKCGHTFCYACVDRHLQQKSSCPSCAAYLSRDHIFPNFLLGQVSRRVAEGRERQNLSQLAQIREILQRGSTSLQLEDLDALLQLIRDRKRDIQQQQVDSSLELLLHFLQHSREHKAQRLQDLQEELRTLESDITQVEQRKSFSSGNMPSLPHVQDSARSLRDCLLDGSRPHCTARASGHGNASQAHPPQIMPGVPAHARALLNGPAQQMIRSAHEQQRQARAATAQPSTAPTQHTAQHASALQAPTAQDPSSLQAQAQPFPAASAPTDSQPPDLIVSVTPAASVFGEQAVQGNSAQILQHAASTSLDHDTAARDGQGNVQRMRNGTTATDASATGHMPQQTALLARNHIVSMDAQNSSTGPSTSDAGGDAASSPGWLTMHSNSRVSKRRLASQFNDLQRCYLRLRREQAAAAMHSADSTQVVSPPLGPQEAASRPTAKRKRGAEEPADTASDVDSGLAAEGMTQAGHEASEEVNVGEGTSLPIGPLDAGGGLQEFARMLSTFTRCSKLKVVAHIPPACTRQTTSILSSIDFDKDARLFATAGVSKRISIYDYGAIVADAASASHKPCSELLTRSKLSCLAWNAGEAAHMISSDYEGVVTLWDVEAGNPLSEYEAHERRIWSIDFCKTEPQLFASGSDDGCVRIWSTSTPNHVAHIPMKANVCCVNFSPSSAHHVAIGSADHNVHLYDLRHASQPVHVFTGHRKAVSYVRYMGRDQVVSASTDSTLRLWDAHAMRPQRTYDGHMNEKNFVGLSIEGEFIACGSETNEIFVYHRAMSKPLAQRLFAPPPSNTAAPQDMSQFISAVCWKPQSQLLLAASSTGAVRLMQLAS